jgi:hypothetical protein
MSAKAKGKDTNTELVLGHGGSILSIGTLPLMLLRIAYAGLPNNVLQELLRLLAPLDIEGDTYGLIFEYFMGQFAASFMQKGGEYFTPASIVKLIVEIIEPYQGMIFDPACGSGGMIVAQIAHTTNSRDPSDYDADLTEIALGPRRVNPIAHLAAVPLPKLSHSTTSLLFRAAKISRGNCAICTNA